MVGFGWFLLLGGGVWMVGWFVLLGGEGRGGWDTRRLNLSSIELETLLFRVAPGLTRFCFLGWGGGAGGGWLDLRLVSSGAMAGGDGGGGWSCWLRLSGGICVGASGWL